jgi:hypothetical protein
VHVDRHLQLLDHGPQAVVGGVVERLHPVDVGRHVGQQQPAPQAVLLDPADVLDGVVDVVDEDLADAGPALGELAAPGFQPAVVEPGSRPGGARSPRAGAAGRTARSWGRTAAPCWGRPPRPPRRRPPAGRCASRCPSCGTAGCRPGP